MSESEKRLRDAIDDALQATGKRAKEAAHKATTEALGALLAEHRAEVDELRQEVERLNTIIRGQSSGDVVVYAAGEVEAKERAARGAALNEVLAAMEARCPGQWQTTWHEPKALVKSLMAGPAERYLSVTKVREALHRHATLGTGAPSPGTRAVALDLGVDLDAEPTRRESTYPLEYEATGELTLASQMDLDADGDGGEFDSDADGKGRAVLPGFHPSETSDDAAVARGEATSASYAKCSRYGRRGQGRCFCRCAGFVAVSP